MSTRYHHVGLTDAGDAFVTVQFDGSKLSLTGVIGPKPNGDARGSCGQCIDDVATCAPIEPFTVELRDRLVAIWRRWHLNDMRAGCEHQRAEWNPAEPLEVVTYGLTTEAYARRNAVLADTAKRALAGQLPELCAQDRALAELDKWYAVAFQPPDADSPLSGCYEVRKRETKTAGWVHEHEHPRGLLCKRCPTCGYRYGSAWLFEAVPDDVLEFLALLPTTDLLPTCWART